MPCLLAIYGESLDVDKALTVLTFIPHKVARKGETFTKRSKRVRSNSYIGAEASNKDVFDLTPQFIEVEKFLKKHFDELLAIEGVDEMCIDFLYDCLIGYGDGGDQVAVQNEYIPASLIKVCGDLSIGIALTQFPKSDE